MADAAAINMARFWQRWFTGAQPARPDAKPADEAAATLDEHLQELERDVRARLQQDTDFFRRKLGAKADEVKRDSRET